MDDLISRQLVIKAFRSEPVDAHYPSWYENIVFNLPSAEPVRKPDEWCTDCKEYDHEKNCCPRFNRVIKSALKVAESDPSDVARDIATIIENEKDMRVIAQGEQEND